MLKNLYFKLREKLTIILLILFLFIIVNAIFASHLPVTMSEFWTKLTVYYLLPFYLWVGWKATRAIYRNRNRRIYTESIKARLMFYFSMIAAPFLVPMTLGFMLYFSPGFMIFFLAESGWSQKTVVLSMDEGADFRRYASSCKSVTFQDIGKICMYDNFFDDMEPGDVVTLHGKKGYGGYVLDRVQHEW